MQQAPDRQDRGFTLVELLIVIVILGILATVVVFAVQGIAGDAEVAASGGDERAIVTAQESYRTQHGTYATEAQLVATGFLHGESELHDITLNGDGTYDVVEPGG